MEQFFTDQAHQNQFERDGYIVLPFLALDQVEGLKKLFYDTHPTLPDTFYSSSFIPDPETKKLINSTVDELYAPKITELFTDVRKLGASFLLKPIGSKGEMYIHQDWTVVDEEKYCSLSVWVPLVDVDENNGAIFVLPGSHKFSDALRGPSLPPIYRDIHPEIREKMHMLPMKAGTAFIFNHALLHASPPNQSDSERLALAYGLIPGKAQLMFYHGERVDDKFQIEKFHVSDTFFQEYLNIGKRPLMGEKVADRVEDFPAMSKEEFEQIYQTSAATKKSLKKNPKESNMRPIFSDPEQQKYFDDHGFLKIQLLNEEEVSDLLTFYHTLNNDHIPSYGFHVSMDKGDPEFAKKVVNKITSVVYPRLEEKLDRCRIMTASFVVKESNPHGVVPPHQDWSFVDENEFVSATVWVPLQDVNMENGALCAVHGSHKFFDYTRCSPSPQAKTPISDHAFTIFPYMQIIEMKAGEALIFNNKTFHASPPNTTDTPRVAAGLGITQAEAQMFHHYLLPGTDPEEIETYKIGPEFFYHYNNAGLSKMFDRGEKPEGQDVLGTSLRKTVEIGSDDLLEMIKSHPENAINGPLIEKMAKLFNYNLDGSKKQDAPAPNINQAPKTEPVQVATPSLPVQKTVEKAAPPSVPEPVASPTKNIEPVIESTSFFQKIINLFKV